MSIYNLSPWRLTARIVQTESTITRPYPCRVESEEEALKRLEEFLNELKPEIGDKLLWVALERSDTDENFWNSDADWQEINRLTP